MQRINVIGTSGSGKSTFSKELAQSLGYPYIQLDQLYWLPNWQEPDDTVFLPKIEAALRPNAWVLDGNYKRTTPIKWRNVDTVIWLDYSFSITVWRACKRAINRIVSKKELWSNTGNVETLGRLFSKESVVGWTIKTHHSNRWRYQAIMKDPKFQRITFYHLRSPEAARRFLDSVAQSEVIDGL
ncbi:MAG: adenylate kinase [Bacteroidota bacterium]